MREVALVSLSAVQRHLMVHALPELVRFVLFHQEAFEVCAAVADSKL